VTDKQPASQPASFDSKYCASKHRGGKNALENTSDNLLRRRRDQTTRIISGLLINNQTKYRHPTLNVLSFIVYYDASRHLQLSTAICN